MRSILFGVALWTVTSACFTVAKLSQDDQEAVTIVSGDTVTIVEIIKGDEVVAEKDGKRGRVRLLGIFAFDDVIVDAEIDGLREASSAYLKATVLQR